MDVELKTVRKFDDIDDVGKRGGGDYADSNDGNMELGNMGGAAKTNPAYVPDGEEPRKEKPRGGMTDTLKFHDADGDDDEDDDEYESSDSEVDEDDTLFARSVGHVRREVLTLYYALEKIIWISFWITVAAGYLVYFGFAMNHNFDVDDEESMRLLIMTIIVYVFIGLMLVWNFLPKDKGLNMDWLFDETLETPSVRKLKMAIKWGLVIATVVIFVVYIVVEVAIDTPRNLVSLAGMASFVLLFFIFSHNPAKVNWRPVFWGLALQFYFALIILRWDFGYNAFLWLGNRIEEFLAHTDAGSEFLFGEDYVKHFFAFKVLTVIIFFSSVVSVLYYWGVMQFIIRHIARFLAFCLGTSPTESLNAAGNIFIGQSEAPLMIRPFIKDMSRSELHAVCTGGFATIAGAVMAAYITMKVPANHLLSASVMSAPAALAMSKLFYPETRKVTSSREKAEAVYNMPKGQERNFIQAASNGASVSISLIANIAVNLIAFIAMLHFVDHTLIWFGHRIGMYSPELTFRFICSYIFWPIAFLMGVDPEDCRRVASMIGTKTFLNEFVAYSELQTHIENTRKHTLHFLNNGTFEFNGDNIILVENAEILYGGILTDRSVVIATYALCGFSNVGSIGIMLGALGAMAPQRKRDITKVVVRAMIAGNVACFMTACIAGRRRFTFGRQCKTEDCAT